MTGSIIHSSPHWNTKFQKKETNSELVSVKAIMWRIMGKKAARPPLCVYVGPRSASDYRGPWRKLSIIMRPTYVDMSFEYIGLRVLYKASHIASSAFGGLPLILDLFIIPKVFALLAIPSILWSPIYSQCYSICLSYSTEKVTQLINLHLESVLSCRRKRICFLSCGYRNRRPRPRRGRRGRRSHPSCSGGWHREQCQCGTYWGSPALNSHMPLHSYFFGGREAARLSACFSGMLRVYLPTYWP